MPPTETSSIEMYNQELALFNQEMDLHMQLLKNAVDSGKCIVSIENILYISFFLLFSFIERIAQAVTSFRINCGNPVIASVWYVSLIFLCNQIVLKQPYLLLL